PNDSGVFMTDLANPESPMYFVSTLDDRKRLACLVSPDNGTTWREFAISDRVFPHRVYSIGGARSQTSEGELIGTFTAVAQSAKAYTEPNSGTVFFFRIPTKPSGSAMIQYRIETVAGNGEPGDTPDQAPDARAVPVNLPFGDEDLSRRNPVSAGG